MLKRSLYHPSIPLAHLLIIGLLFVTAPAAVAQDSEPAPDESATDDVTVGMQGGRYGVGFAASWPAYGISGTLQINEKLTGQVVLGFFGAVSNFGARGWYRFKRDPQYDLYGYGSVGLFRYTGVTGSLLSGLREETENVLGLGAGVGVEAGLRKLFDDEDFPPIFLNAEIGLAYANFDFYNFSAFTFGSGIHYRFGAN